MRLYATTTSERASKSQGGNNFLKIELSLHEGETDAGDIELSYSGDWIDVDYISQGGYITTLAKFPKIKGNK